MSIFIQVTPCGVPLVVEITDDGRFLIQDPTGAVDIESEQALVELGFDVPKWLNMMLDDQLQPVSFLMQEGLLSGSARDLWWLAFADKIITSKGFSLDEDFKSAYLDILTEGKKIASLPMGDELFDRRASISFQVRDLSGKGVASASRGYLIEATTAIVGYIGYIFDRYSDSWRDMEEHYFDVISIASDALGLDICDDGNGPEADAFRRWMVREAVRQIKAQEIRKNRVE